MMRGFAATVDLVPLDGLLELVEIRRVLESHAAGQAAARATPELDSELSELLAAMERETDHTALSDLDARFHQRICDAGGNESLAALVEVFARAAATTTSTRSRRSAGTATRATGPSRRRSRHATPWPPRSPRERTSPTPRTGCAASAPGRTDPLRTAGTSDPRQLRTDPARRPGRRRCGDCAHRPGTPRSRGEAHKFVEHPVSAPKFEPQAETGPPRPACR